jgi:hypothetical protein
MRDGKFAGQSRGKPGRLLEDTTGGQLRTLDDLGIVPNPRFALVHGPLQLHIDGVWLESLKPQTHCNQVKFHALLPPVFQGFY